MTVDVRIELVDAPATLFRVTGTTGLWYDAEGRETGLVHTLSEGAAAALPMGPHPVFRDAGRRWISATDRLADIALWFSRGDMTELLERGYVLEAIEVARYRTLHFPTYAHAVFCIEDVLSSSIIDPSSPYLVAAA